MSEEMNMLSHISAWYMNRVDCPSQVTVFSQHLVDMVSEHSLKKVYPRYTYELHQWIPSYLEIVEKAGVERFKRLLKSFNLETSGGRVCWTL